MNKFFSALLLAVATVTLHAQPGYNTPPPPPCNPNGCTTNSLIDVCPPGSNNVVSSTIDGVYHRGNNGNQLGAGAIWRYRNMATVSGVPINLEVRIDQVFQSILQSLDDDAALDQNNGSLATYFCPRIGPDASLTGGASGADRRGFVTFTMRFYKNAANTNNNTDADFATPVNLTGLNYVHYDIDGYVPGPSYGIEGSWFRETGMAQKVGLNNPQVISNNVTDLSAYNYADGGFDWTGFAGGVCEKDGVSKCAQNVAAFRYNGAFNSITFRMGYDYNRGNSIGQPIRQYGARLGCFNFPQESVLPVTITSFNAIYRNNITTVQWTAVNEVNFQKYIVERSTDGYVYAEVGHVSPLGTDPSRNYEFQDNVTGITANVFYYRLKMLDIDQKHSYTSNVMVKKEAETLTNLILSPNPVTSGSGTIRLNSKRNSMAELRVLDMSGRTVIQQQSRLYEGTNSISLNQLDKLPPGIYSLQLINEGAVSVIKFSVVR